MAPPLASALRRMPERRPPSDVQPDDPRLPTMREQVAERLRRIRGDMPDDEFAELVNRVAAFHLRWLGHVD